MKPLDLSFLLAVESGKTFSGAARTLGVTHTTVSRKIRELEGYFGTKLIEHQHDQIRLTAEGERALSTAASIEQELQQLERLIQGKDSLLSGSISLTTIDILAVKYMPQLQALTEKHPDIELNISVDTTVRSLSRREAEVAIRATNAPEEYLFGRKLETLEFRPYIASKAFKALEKPHLLEQLPWVIYNSRECMSLAQAWMKQHIPNIKPRASVASPLLMQEAIRNNMGVGFLPSDVADKDPHLSRLNDDLIFSQDVWILTPMELRHTARIRAVFDALA